MFRFQVMDTRKSEFYALRSNSIIAGWHQGHRKASKISSGGI